MRPRLTVYSREDCHLCDDLLQVLAVFREPLGFEVAIVDIDLDPALAEKYNALVPVLALGESEICHHFLDKQALEQALAEHS